MPDCRINQTPASAAEGSSIKTPLPSIHHNRRVINTHHFLATNFLSCHLSENNFNFYFLPSRSSHLGPQGGLIKDSSRRNTGERYPGDLSRHAAKSTIKNSGQLLPSPAQSFVPLPVFTFRHYHHLVNILPNTSAWLSFPISSFPFPPSPPSCFFPPMLGRA